MVAKSCVGAVQFYDFYVIMYIQYNTVRCMELLCRKRRHAGEEHRCRFKNLYLINHRSNSAIKSTKVKYIQYFVDSPLFFNIWVILLGIITPH
jgi:hypothetical protein